jgi:hypothetical protein
MPAEIFEKVDKVFSGKVSPGILSERRSPQSSNRGVESRDTQLERRIRVHQRGTSRIVQMETYLIPGSRNQIANSSGCGHASGVCQGD